MGHESVEVRRFTPPRTSTGNPPTSTNNQRTCTGHLSESYRTSIENMLRIYRTSTACPSKFTGNPPTFTKGRQTSTRDPRIFIVNRSDIYRKYVRLGVPRRESRNEINLAPGVWAISSGRPSPPIFFNPANADKSERTSIENISHIHRTSN